MRTFTVVLEVPGYAPLPRLVAAMEAEFGSRLDVELVGEWGATFRVRAKAVSAQAALVSVGYQAWYYVAGRCVTQHVHVEHDGRLCIDAREAKAILRRV